MWLITIYASREICSVALLCCRDAITKKTLHNFSLHKVLTFSGKDCNCQFVGEFPEHRGRSHLAAKESGVHQVLSQPTDLNYQYPLAQKCVVCNQYKETPEAIPTRMVQITSSLVQKEENRYGYWCGRWFNPCICAGRRQYTHVFLNAFESHGSELTSDFNGRDPAPFSSILTELH